MFADCPQDWYGSGPGKVDLHGVRQHGSACHMVLEWRLAYSRIDLSLLQHQSTSQEQHGRLRTTSCIIIPLYETLHDRVTSEESLRDSEPSDIFLGATSKLSVKKLTSL